MRFKFVSLFLVFLISACTFQVEVISTPTPQPTEQPTQEALQPFETATPFVTTELSPTPPPLPTFTATTTVTPAAVANNGVSPIRFAPNGTYVDIIDSISAGKSKTYSINAMKGQIMSISIRQNDETTWTSLTMRIIGTDDSILCPRDCEFWRGTLPVTEEYFAIVTAAGDAMDFTMRVAIDPPGRTTQSFIYENKYRNASLSYTDVFAPALFPGAELTRIKPELGLRYIDTEAYTQTNLLEAYFLFGSSTDSQIIASCTEPISFGGPETIVGDETINGVTFTKSTGGGVGAGNIYQQTYYRAVHNGTCYEITYFIHYGNIGNYSGDVKEFDQDALLAAFDETLATLVLK
jgi:hypothetical protein